MGLIREYKAGSGDPEKVKADLEWKDHRRKMVREKRRMSRVVDVSLGTFTDPEELALRIPKPETRMTNQIRNPNDECGGDKVRG